MKNLTDLEVIVLDNFVQDNFVQENVAQTFWDFAEELTQETKTLFGLNEEAFEGLFVGGCESVLSAINRCVSGASEEAIESLKRDVSAVILQDQDLLDELVGEHEHEVSLWADL